MPNWCLNSLQISGSKEELDVIEKQLTECGGKDFFDIFVDPAKEDQEDWYNYNLENYGCKWNCSAHEWDRTDETCINISFDSPWGPPIALYEKIESDGLSVYAQYFESGMCFVGQYTDGYDETYEYSDIESLDQIPEELVESWSLREMLEEQEEFDREINDDK